MVTEKKESVCK